MTKRTMFGALLFEVAYYAVAVFLGLSLGILLLGLSTQPVRLDIELH
jgi:hypothetical protein